MYCSRLFDDRRDGGHGAARDLRLARGFARVAPQARQAAHGFGEQAILLADETNVAIVERVGQRRREAQADAADEILRLVAIEHDGVQHAQGIAAGIEIEAQRERQPAARRRWNVCLRS